MFFTLVKKKKKKNTKSIIVYCSETWSISVCQMSVKLPQLLSLYSHRYLHVKRFDENKAVNFCCTYV